MSTENRYVKIDRKHLRFSCSKTIPSSSITLTEFHSHGKTTGAFTFALAKNLHDVFFEAAKNGDVGRKVWKFTDNKNWFCATKLSNSNGFYLHIMLARSSYNANPLSFFIPSGSHFEGWFAVAEAIDSILSYTSSNPYHLHTHSFNCKSPVTQPTHPPLNIPKRTYAQTVLNLNQKVPHPNIQNYQTSSPFLCDKFAAPTHVSISSSRYGGFLNIEHSRSDTPLGLWADAYLISSPVVVDSWENIGYALCQKLQIITPFQIFPINSVEAIFHADKDLSMANLEFSFTVNNVALNVVKWNGNFWRNSQSNHHVFHLEIFGVPYQLWSSEIMHAIGSICGEVLLISPSTLKLKDLNAMRIKVRNVNGINSIPRVIRIVCGKLTFMARIIVTGNSYNVDHNLLISPSPDLPGLNFKRANSSPDSMGIMNKRGNSLPGNRFSVLLALL